MFFPPFIHIIHAKIHFVNGPPSAVDSLPPQIAADLNGDGVADAYWDNNLTIRRMDGQQSHRQPALPALLELGRDDLLGGARRPGTDRLAGTVVSTQSDCYNANEITSDREPNEPAMRSQQVVPTHRGSGVFGCLQLGPWRIALLAAAVILASINEQPAAVAVVGALTDAMQQLRGGQEFSGGTRDMPKHAVEMAGILRST